MRIHISLLLAVAVASTDAIGFGDVNGNDEERMPKWKNVFKGSSSNPSRESLLRDVGESAEVLDESKTKVTAARDIDEEIAEVNSVVGHRINDAREILANRWIDDRILPSLPLIKEKDDMIGFVYANRLETLIVQRGIDKDFQALLLKAFNGER